MPFVKNRNEQGPLFGIVNKLRSGNHEADWTSHDSEMLDFYSQFISRGDLCFDVGANIGNRVKIFLKLGARVIALEPQEACVGILRETYGRNRRLTIMQSAVGESEGRAEMMISNANTISSLSPAWVDSVIKSGRFSDYTWGTKQVVPVTTLDKLIDDHGSPAFIKIDVEGYEYEVIKGLSRPVKALSLEFTPEFIEAAFKCMEFLERLGDIRVNYSLGESMRLELEEWVRPKDLAAILPAFRDDNILFGDIYVRFLCKEPRPKRRWFPFGRKA